LDTKLDILGVALIVLPMLILLSYLSPNSGVLTRGVINFLNTTFGWGAFVPPIAIAAVGVWLIWRHFGDELPEIPIVRIIGLALVYFGMLALMHAIVAELIQPIGPALVDPTLPTEQRYVASNIRECEIRPGNYPGYQQVQVYLSDIGIARCGHGGGYIGYTIVYYIAQYLGSVAAFVIPLVVVLGGIMLVAKLTLDDVMKGAKTGYERVQEQRAKSAQRSKKKTFVRNADGELVEVDDDEEEEEEPSAEARRSRASSPARPPTAVPAGSAKGDGSPSKSAVTGRPSIVTGKGPSDSKPGAPSSPSRPGLAPVAGASAAPAAAARAGAPGGALAVPPRPGTAEKEDDDKKPSLGGPPGSGGPPGRPGASGGPGRPGGLPGGGSPPRAAMPGAPAPAKPDTSDADKKSDGDNDKPSGPGIRPGLAAAAAGAAAGAGAATALGGRAPSQPGGADDDDTKDDDKKPSLSGPPAPGRPGAGPPRPGGAPPRPGLPGAGEPSSDDDDDEEGGKPSASGSGLPGKPPPGSQPGGPGRSPGSSGPPGSGRPSERTFGPSSGPSIGSSRPAPKPEAKAKDDEAEKKGTIVFDDTAKENDPLKGAIDLENSVIADAGKPSGSAPGASRPPGMPGGPPPAADDDDKPAVSGVPGAGKPPGMAGPPAIKPPGMGGPPGASRPPGAPGSGPAGPRPGMPPGMKPGGSNRQPAAPLGGPGSNRPPGAGKPPESVPDGPRPATSAPGPRPGAGSPPGANPPPGAGSPPRNGPSGAMAAPGVKPPGPPKKEPAKAEKAKPNGTTETKADPAKQAQPPKVKREAEGGTPEWKLPVLNEVLDRSRQNSVSDEELRTRAEIIEMTLSSFGAPGRVVEVNHGPVITQFGVEPDYIESRGGKRTKVKVGKIAALSDDIALALAAPSIRVEAPVPGKGFVGVEVPNAEPSVVGLRDVMETPDFKNKKAPLKLALGQDVSGSPIVADLPSMPHLLIAGTTGSGKSVCVNGIIAAMLMSHTPEELKLIMVDPKRVELTNYNGIPHLMAPVVTDLERIVGVLKWVQREMDDRYRTFAMVGARNITDYNQRVERGTIEDGEKMPYIVVIVDELADLMMLAPDETERVITRLAQMARATGIHIILSTQRPSVDVVTGLIKANFPARIAFAVATGVDSRVILDTPGAEKLLGRGDMLFQPPDVPMPIRLQGVFVSDDEINNVVEHWREEAKRLGIADSKTKLGLGANAPTMTSGQQQALFSLKASKSEGDDDEDDMYAEAVDLVRDMEKASISLLQRHLRIGYTRAARLIDLMEERGVIGPHEGGSKPREVLDEEGNPIGEFQEE